MKRLEQNNLTPAQRNQLVENSLDHIYRVVCKVCPKGSYDSCFEDCYQEAVLAVIKASAYYDPSRGSFEAYAAHESYCACKDFLYRNHVLPINTSQNTAIYSYFKRCSAEEARQDRELTANERAAIAKSVHMSKAAYHILEHGITSLDRPINASEDSEECFGSHVADNSAVDPLEELYTEALFNAIDQFLSTIKSCRELYTKIFKAHMMNLINAEFKGTTKLSLIELVKNEYPEFTVTESDDMVTAESKRKKLDSIYCSVQDFWKRNCHKLREQLEFEEFLRY